MTKELEGCHTEFKLVCVDLEAVILQSLEDFKEVLFVAGFIRNSDEDRRLCRRRRSLRLHRRPRTSSMKHWNVCAAFRKPYSNKPNNVIMTVFGMLKDGLESGGML